jgi:hypothetical protein
MMDAVLTYARARLVALGYQEWKEAFNWKNVPKTISNAQFHVELGQGSASKLSIDNLETVIPFTVRVFIPPERDTLALRDRAALRVNTITAAFLLAANRLTQSTLKNVGLESFRIDALDDSNDNGVIISVSFTAMVVLSTR